MAFGTPEGVVEEPSLNARVSRIGSSNPRQETVPSVAASGNRWYERASRGFGGWGRRAVDEQVVVCVASDGRAWPLFALGVLVIAAMAGAIGGAAGTRDRQQTSVAVRANRSVGRFE